MRNRANVWHLAVALWSGALRDERYVRDELWREVLGADPDTDPRYTDELQPVPRAVGADRRPRNREGIFTHADAY